MDRQERLEDHLADATRDMEENARDVMDMHPFQIQGLCDWEAWSSLPQAEAVERVKALGLPPPGGDSKGTLLNLSGPEGLQSIPLDQVVGLAHGGLRGLDRIVVRREVLFEVFEVFGHAFVQGRDVAADAIDGLLDLIEALLDTVVGVAAVVRTGM